MTFLRRAAIAAVALLVACGAPTAVDTESLVEQIPAAVSPDAPDSVTEVTCGDELPIGEGLTMTCRATLAGTPVSLEVTQVDDNASLAVSVDRTLVDVPGLADAVGQQFTDDLRVETMVDCTGPPLVVAIVGTTISCTATDSLGVGREILVILVDDKGTYRVELA